MSFDFKKLHFESPETPDRAWLEWFREEWGRKNFMADWAPAQDAPFAFNGTSRQLPDLIISRGACTAANSRLLTERAVDDDFGIVITLAGNMSVKVARRDLTMTPGMAYLGRRDLASEVNLGEGTENLTVSLLRRRLLEPLVPDLDDRIGSTLPSNSQEVRLLLGYLRMLDSEDTVASPEARHLITTHVHDLAALVFGCSRDAQNVVAERGVRAARLAVIKQDILANLADPRLSVGMIAARQSVTPRYVHMLFETEAITFTGFVVSSRLARAHSMLIDPRFATWSIGTIALHIGFGDLSYFNRTFRRRYGVTPSDVRITARKNGG